MHRLQDSTWKRLLGFDLCVAFEAQGNQIVSLIRAALRTRLYMVGDESRSTATELACVVVSLEDYKALPGVKRVVGITLNAQEWYNVLRQNDKPRRKRKRNECRNQKVYEFDYSSHVRIIPGDATVGRGTELSLIEDF